MECEVCSRVPSSRLPFYCITCARNVLYQPRIDHAIILLEKERLESEIAHTTSSSEGYEEGRELQRTSRRYELESARTVRVQIDARLEQILSHSEMLRREVQAARQDISARKVSLTERQRILNAVRQTVAPRRNMTLENLDNEMSRKDQAWISKAKRLEGHRAFLCREAAKLYGLKCKRRMKNGVVVEQYSLGGVIIPDLRDMNNIRPEELSAAIANISHFLLLTSHYLAVRLPAEIIVPHRAWPRPAILTPSNSYTGRDVPFPGTTPIQQYTTSPTASRHGDSRPLPRVRPLYVEKRLPQLAHEDSTGYSLFIEAVSLLAWDIAWLCRSQGCSAGTESWEDICGIGKNLWRLFGPSPSLQRARSSRDVGYRQKLPTNGSPSQRSRSLPRLGQYSHASAHSFLSSNEGMSLIRGWKLARYMTIADSLKRALLGEMSNAEWELLEEREWDDGGGDFNEDETVFVKGRNEEASTAWDDARSIMTTRTRASILQPADHGGSTENPKTKGTSGWTKLKPREKG